MLTQGFLMLGKALDSRFQVPSCMFYCWELWVAAAAALGYFMVRSGFVRFSLGKSKRMRALNLLATVLLVVALYMAVLAVFNCLAVAAARMPG